MKRIILMVSLLISMIAFGAEENEGLFIKMYPSVGLGLKPMSDGNQLYGTTKIFPVQYGLAEIGASFLGIGYSVGSNSSFTFSPIGLRAKNLMVSMDLQQNRADGVGLSLNYYIPLDFP